MDQTALYVVELREEICRLIRTSCVSDRLCPHVIDPMDAGRIRRIYNTSPRQATNKLLDILLTSTVQGKWTAFQEALDAAEYPYLAKLVKERQPYTKSDQQRKIIEVFAPYMQRHINPVDVIPSLYKARVINDIDRDEILTTYNRLGPTAATLSLLDHIQCRLPADDWYKILLKVLYENGHRKLVKELEPDFHPNFDFKSVSILNPATREIQRGKETLSIDNVKTKLKDLRSELSKFVKVSNIIHYLVPDILSGEFRDELLENEEEYPVEACLMLVDEVIASDDPGKFIDVLYATDYSYFADILSEKQTNQSRFQVLYRRIQLYRPYICTKMDPLNVIPYLLREGVVNYLDREEIISAMEHFGNTRSVNVLLDCIQCRKSPPIWYTHFLDSLLECGYQELVNLIEPDYSKNPELWKRKLEECHDDVDDIEFIKNQLPLENKEIVKYLDQALATFTDDEESLVRSELDIRLEIDRLRKEYKRKEQRLLDDLYTERQYITGEMRRRKEILQDIRRCCLAGDQSWSLDSAKTFIDSNIIRKNDERPMVLEFQQNKLIDLMEFLGAIKSNVTLEKGVGSNVNNEINEETEKCDIGKCDD